jgi:hypothetical protein
VRVYNTASLDNHSLTHWLFYLFYLFVREGKRTGQWWHGCSHVPLYHEHIFPSRPCSSMCSNSQPSVTTKHKHLY